MEKIAEISFQSRVTEKSYFHIQQEYPSIIEKCKGSTQLILDFSFSQIKQSTVDRIIKDLFYMPNIHDDDQDRPFIHKYFELQSIHLNIQGSLITNVDFVSSFFLYHNMKEITFVCEYPNQVTSFLRATKQTSRIQKIVCKDYFEKKYGICYVSSSEFFTESILEWKGIEEQIEILSVQIKSENFDIIIEKLKNCSLLKELKCEIYSLSNIKNQIKDFIELLSNSCKNIQKLEIVVYFDSLLPPIALDSFQIHCKLSINYKCLYIKTQTLSSIYRKIYAFIQSDSSLIIDGCVEYQNRSLKLDLSERILATNEDNSTKEDEVKQIIKFLSKCIPELESINLRFSSQQFLSKESWVAILKLFCSSKTLISVEIFGTNSSKQMCALFQSKLMKAGKVLASVNENHFKHNELTLRAHQISDAVLKKLLEQNCFNNEEESNITKINIDSDIVMGHILPFSFYLKNVSKRLSSFKVTITSQTCDLTSIFPTLAKDRFIVEQFTEELQFQQVGNHFTHFSFRQSFQFVQMQFGKIYDFHSYLFDMRSAIGILQAATIQKILSPISNYSSITSHTHYNQILSKIDFFLQLRQAHITFIQKRLLPFQIYTFFEIIGPHLPLNPYMIVTDLYYD